MSISFKTDHQRLAGGAHKYTVTVETDIKRYFESIQQVARDCVDDSAKTHKAEQDIVTPMICEKHSLSGSSGIDYVCNWCECSLLPSASGFYVHCPRCGKKIDYSNHNFLREGLNAIR